MSFNLADSLRADNSMSRMPVQQRAAERRSMLSGSTSEDEVAERHDFADDDDIGEIAVVARSSDDAAQTPESSISITTRVEYSALVRGVTQEVFGLVTVHAQHPPQDEAAEGGRQPMDIVCVLDVSGSMRGEKIGQLQEAVDFIIRQAEATDRISIVSFESQARRVLPLRKMVEEGKASATDANRGLRAGGGTSIAGGLKMGIAVMEARRQKNAVSAILLLTDGQDRSTEAALPPLLERAQRENVALYAFGFGFNHDAELLSKISEQAHTPFTYVEDTEKIAEAFAGTVGGLSSVVAQGVELTLDARVELTAVHTPFTQTRESGSRCKVNIPDMFAGERRDVLVELAVPTAEASNELVLLEASASYKDLNKQCISQAGPVTMVTTFVDEAQPEMEPDDDVCVQRERVEVAKALQGASACSDRGQFDEAHRVLDEQVSKMKAAQKKTAFSSSLEEELQEARQRMTNKADWASGGAADVKDSIQMHCMQRTTNMMESKSSKKTASRAIYANQAQKKWVGISKG